jgi:hypothetical protein
MEIQRDGSFTHTITSEQLIKGLRPTKRVPRNSGFLVQCDGMIGRDAALQSLDVLIPIATPITDGFPFPQIFILPTVIIVCGRSKIYEWENGGYTLKYTCPATLVGETWEYAASYDWIYLSNNLVSVVRDPGSKQYAVSNLPTANAICMFNGQLIIGSPDMKYSPSVTIPVTPIGIAVGLSAVWTPGTP